MAGNKLHFDYFDSPIGEIELASTDSALLSLTFTKIAGKTADKQPFSYSPVNDLIKQQLSAYFNKQLKVFDLPIQPAGTDFQKMVWNELLKIPFGTTISYHSLAKKMGDENSIRAVANANGKNPIAIIIPCHRVIGSDGKLIGYSGEIWRKKYLLEHESKQEKLF